MNYFVSVNCQCWRKDFDNLIHIIELIYKINYNKYDSYTREAFKMLTIKIKI